MWSGPGLYWVIGFFVISGYCIQLSVERQIEGRTFPLGQYLLARLSRILPLYYLAAACGRGHREADRIAPGRVLLAQRAEYPVLFSLRFWSIQNLTQTYGSFAPSWSITNEMFYYLLYGGIAVPGLGASGIRPTTLGMVLCIGAGRGTRLGLLPRGPDSPTSCSPGLLFGLGIIWFLGAMVAEYRQSLRDSRLARAVSAWWLPVLIAGDGDVVLAERSPPGCLPDAGHGLHAHAGPVRRLRTRSAKRAGSRALRALIRLAGPGELSDVPVPRADRDAHRLRHSQVATDQRLAGDVVCPLQRGDRLGSAAGSACRAADHGLACRLLEAAEASFAASGARGRGHPDPWPVRSEAASAEETNMILAVCFTNFGPYHLARLRALASRLRQAVTA